jgi:hypothetical protein
MARWKIMVPHYLNVPGEQWEYVENDRKTGRPKRHKFNVPRLLDPGDPTCWTNRWGNKDDAEGEVIVCHEGTGNESDIIFIGDPTPDMVPVDDEAKEISAKFTERWAYKPENAVNSFSQSMVDKFQIEQAAVQTKAPAVEGLSELTAVLGNLVKQNQEILAQATAARRI